MGLQERLANARRQPGHITPDEMETAVNSQGQRSRIGRYRATTAHMLRQGRDNPFKIAVPAYQQETTNGTADDSETFNLSHSVTDTPVTQAVVVWLDGTYYGTPDSVDYDNDTITVSDPDTGSNVHIYYISDAAASLEVRKAASNADTGSQRVFTGNLGLIHKAPQIEQPEYLRLNQTRLHPWVGTDMTVDAYIDAPYTVRWTDPAGDGTEPTNALLHIPAFIGQSEVRGLTSAVGADMGQQ